MDVHSGTEWTTHLCTEWTGPFSTVVKFLHVFLRNWWVCFYCFMV